KVLRGRADQCGQALTKTSVTIEQPNVTRLAAATFRSHQIDEAALVLARPLREIGNARDEQREMLERDPLVARPPSPRDPAEGGGHRCRTCSCGGPSISAETARDVIGHDRGQGAGADSCMAVPVAG